MPCYKPLLANYSGEGQPQVLPQATQRRWRDRVIALGPTMIALPCGHCMGCRLENTRQWAVRCMHERDSHEASSFITLTYDRKHLPPGRTLRKRDFDLFRKRLREQFGPFRFFQCGEYGDQTARPHHHAAIFGHDFRDGSMPYHPDSPYWLHDGLTECWGMGNVIIGNLEFSSAAYVAAYITKKIRGPVSKLVYADRVPPYATMSRGGRTGHGLAHEWISTWWTSVYPRDEVVVDGHSQKPPRYYDLWLKKHHPTVWEEVRAARKERMLEHGDEVDYPQLDISKVVKQAQVELGKIREAA